MSVLLFAFLRGRQHTPWEVVDERSVLRLIGLTLPVAVFLLGVVGPRQGGFTSSYVATYAALLIGLGVVEQAAPAKEATLWRRLLYLGAELGLCFWVVRVQGSLVRPAPIYLLPASRALLMFGDVRGFVLSLSIWVVYAINVGMVLWPSRLNEYPNYLVFMLAPYSLAVVLTAATLRQAAGRRHVQALYDELRSAHEELKELHQQVREAAIAQERNRLAREIHDTLAHYLTIVNIQLEAAEKLGTQQLEKALEQVRRDRRLTLECLQEVRRSVAALRSATLEEMSLSAAVGKLVTEFRETTGIEVLLDIRLPETLALGSEVVMTLYRVVQEGLTNVHRHAKASMAEVTLAANSGVVELSVVDNGVGSPASDNPYDRGFGLLGLRERVQLLDGQFAFGRAPSGGSRLSVSLPISKRP